MSKYAHIQVSASISTDFYVEVPDDATESQIKDLAYKEVIYPNKYPEVIDAQLQRMGIQIRGIDSMLRSWEIDNVKYVINGNKENT